MNSTADAVFFHFKNITTIDHACLGEKFNLSIFNAMTTIQITYGLLFKKREVFQHFCYNLLRLLSKMCQRVKDNGS